MNRTTPGFYVEDISPLITRVIPVATGVPAFIGYTERTPEPAINRITSLAAYEALYGAGQPQRLQISLNADLLPDSVTVAEPTRYRLYDSLRFYFANGGGPCHIVPAGNYADLDAGQTESIDAADLTDALAAAALLDEPALLLLPDSVRMDGLNEGLQRDAYHNILQQALQQCADLGDRFLIADLFDGDSLDPAVLDLFRTGLGTENLSYGAAYHPWLQTTLAPYFRNRDVQFDPGGITDLADLNLEDIRVRLAAKEWLRLAERSFDLIGAAPDGETARAEGIRAAGAALSALQLVTGALNHSDPPAGFTDDVQQNLEDARNIDPLDAGAVDDALDAALIARDQIGLLLTLLDPIPDDETEAAVKRIFTASFQSRLDELLQEVRLTLPPSGALAGAYAATDRERGVWKAPAPVVLEEVIGPAADISAPVQGELNVHGSGKSINAIRSFAGRGTLVFGARTLAGNDNEWRYVPVRRFFLFAEESLRKACEPFVFETNDANTWVRMRALILDFLTTLWKAGALTGATPDEAFFVRIGLGSSMTNTDILEGRMNVDIGLAAVRPAEFIFLRFSLLMQQS